ncbi:MAG TPA: NAD(P)H-dependent oxidoreductase [Pseudobdellovibrionaceae bacterium]|jgi:multimeric flavodoxin WrbA
MHILILNGSVHGDRGNCGIIIQEIRKRHQQINWSLVNLSKTKFGPGLEKKIKKSDAILCLTGTYWDSWGSPLQKFLEEATDLEARPEILGKPAGVCVLMHSVGGKSVLSRLQGVFSSMGFLIPPMSGMAYSLSGQLALKSKSMNAKDFWCLEDIEVIVQNLVIAVEKKILWKTWPIDRKNFRKTWVK